MPRGSAKRPIRFPFNLKKARMCLGDRRMSRESRKAGP